MMRNGVDGAAASSAMRLMRGGGETSADTNGARSAPGEGGTAGPVPRRSGDERLGAPRRSDDAPGEDGADAPIWCLQQSQRNDGQQQRHARLAWRGRQRPIRCGARRGQEHRGASVRCPTTTEEPHGLGNERRRRRRLESRGDKNGVGWAHLDRFEAY
ncbi:unnamed protein product [Miscanthus lutarioriparius]|uniref:Uncharacterized protein n=1 Tax=Miscanthus lutarioriparius TaxID=422564 RepID=A0A811MNQ1_9POAL|nr:unnamed protein product [Miscanthus lutarioriparius]